MLVELSFIALLQPIVFMSSFSSNYLTIHYSTEQNLLVARWQRSVMPFEMHRGYGALLDEAAAQDCRFWLVDTRRRTSVDAADVHWMLDEFYPKLHPRLGRTTFLAFLMAPNQLAGILADPSVPALNVLDGRPYVIQRFTEEANALTWLQQMQEHETLVERK